MASAQGILWDRQTLIRLTLGTPNWRTEPSAVALPPPATPAPAGEPSVEQICRTLRWLRDFRHELHQEWLRTGKPPALKAQMEQLDSQANRAAEMLWRAWGDEDKPKWKQAS